MSRNPTAGFRRLPRVADRMTAAHHDLVAQSLAAERSGDAARALELHASVPALDLRSRHHVLLAQLAALGDELPGWVWARWAAYQVQRCEDLATETGTVQRLALAFALDNFHDDRLADCHADGGDPMRVAARVAGESWLFQQLLVHEMGGLERFVDELATGRLAEHAELARSWTGARLSGYQVGASLPDGRLRVHDPAADAWTEVLDLGARTLADEAGWVLGRLVPSGVDDLLMFDTAPVAVPERVARDVAAAPEPWQRIKDALDAGELVERRFLRADLELTTDVLSIDLLRIGTPPADLERVTAQLRSGRDEIPRAAFRVLRRAVDGDVLQSDAAHVAAAILQPGARKDARRMLVRDGSYGAWARWAELVHPPARGLLLDLAEASRAAG
ncbi:hypothetical protein GCM10011376_33890 [Nocardioides flavus (ex Wang et al. 2016)]|uniref:Uncharacterized protein n=1 Tax=Nocardioides flavus (ex Wang et al. 2016) TaxID=2058780 RepID=A0ABQ3HRJ4_9ACTN|nr:hypothetical protein [Nocardioides flavus (ex Wang et al. 2016)]GHE18779.1 hypothetical protein GCM10011376_33890 [Nocardioides flavus (ex Wang et al. 2016)]